MKDPQLVAEAAKMKLAVDSIDGAEVDEVGHRGLFAAEGRHRESRAGEPAAVIVDLLGG